MLGSEGRLGVVTRATVQRAAHMPEFEAFYGVFFHNWEQGAAAVREIAQAGIGVSMLRLSNAVETTTTLALAGKDDLVKWAERGLRAAGFGNERSLLVFGVTGTRRQASASAPRSIGNHPGAWRFDDRHNNRQDVEEVTFLFTLPAQHTLGGRLCPGYARDCRPLGERDGNSIGNPESHSGGFGK